MLQIPQFLEGIFPTLLMLGCGLLLKWVDDIGDHSQSLNYPYIEIIGLFFAGVNGMGLGWIAVQGQIWSGLVLGIILGVFVTGKIDTIYLWFGVIIFFISWMVWDTIFNLGIGGIVLTIIVAAAVAIDEIGHELIKNYTDNVIIRSFFEYRWTLRALALLLFCFQILDLWNLIGIWLFDFGYYLGERTFFLR